MLLQLQQQHLRHSGAPRAGALVMLLQRDNEAASGELGYVCGGGTSGLPEMKSYKSGLSAFPGLSVVKNRRAACLPFTSGPRGPV